MPKDNAPRSSVPDLATLKKLVLLMTENDLVELELEPAGKVKIRRREDTKRETSVAWLPQQLGNAAAPPAAVPPVISGAAAPAPPPAPAPEASEDLFEFKSPIVGTFYRQPSPDKEAFVEKGKLVRPDSVLCIIEAMKVMNEIRAEVSGEIVEVLAKNSEAVEYGQPLFLIRLDK
ncbi:MAG: acetyl-CoA carboxylase biotin carboxyl carrier protein [Planctomycetota bacterium]